MVAAASAGAVVQLLYTCTARAGATSAAQCDPFALPEPAQRPMFRWWWPGGAIEFDQIEREVNAMADAGFGGFEIADVRDGTRVPMDPKVYGWGGARSGARRPSRSILPRGSISRAVQ